MTWDALVPADWNPAKEFEALDLAHPERFGPARDEGAGAVAQRDG